MKQSLSKRSDTLNLFLLGVLLVIGAGSLSGQAVKGTVSVEDGPPSLTYAGLVPGLDDGARVREVLGEPSFESRWYSYKLYYPADRGEGLVDVVHLHGPSPEQGLANIEASSVPKGLETLALVVGRFGAPEYRLQMSTWSLLDYSALGLRFVFNEDGRTTGVAYFPHGRARVPAGERRSMDLRHLRQGPQPQPERPAELGGLRAGESSIDITPVEASWMPEPFEVHDPLEARVLVLERGDQLVALVGADLFGMGAQEISVIRAALAEQGIDEVVVAMSHNHAAPDTIGIYGHYPAEYIGFIQQQIIRAVVTARGKLEPVAAMRSASRELAMEGARVQGLFRNARNPGILDPTLSVVRFDRADGSAIASLVHFACHVESLATGSRKIGADFPGTMARRLEQNGHGKVVFLNGAVGGMVSGDNPERTFESSAEMGERLATLVEELVANAQPPATFEFLVERREIEIPMMNPALRPFFEGGLRELKHGRVMTDMVYFRFGEVDLITLPGELLPEVSFEILEKMEGFPRLLVGLANDQLGYMIPPYDFREGAYEESVSQGPSAALVVRDTALRLLSGQR